MNVKTKAIISNPDDQSIRISYASLAFPRRSSQDWAKMKKSFSILSITTVRYTY